MLHGQGSSSPTSQHDRLADNVTGRSVEDRGEGGTELYLIHLHRLSHQSNNTLINVVPVSSEHTLGRCRSRDVHVYYARSGPYGAHADAGLLLRRQFRALTVYAVFRSAGRHRLCLAVIIRILTLRRIRSTLYTCRGLRGISY